MSGGRKPRAPREALPPAAAIDALYGLEPVIEPGAGGSEVGTFVDVDCPYCGERYVTPIDLTAGSASFIEDCQVCCRPIELGVELDGAGGLAALSVRRLD